MLPKLDGLEVCKRLRAESEVPIIMLTARDDELDKVLGLELGADDYITKPFSIREFRSRVRALLRRASVARPVARTARRSPPTGSGSTSRGAPSRYAGPPVQLTYVEFELLRTLAAHPGRVYSRRDAPRGALGRRPTTASRGRSTCTSAICARSSSTIPADPEYILTVRGVGYRFRDR